MLIKIISLSIILSLAPIATTPIATGAQGFKGLVQLENQKFEDLTVDGMAVFENSNFNSLTVRGTLTFQSINIAENLDVKGDANGKGLKCKDLTVHGSLKGKALNVKGKAQVMGSFLVSESHFTNLELASEDIKIEDSQINNIVVKRTGRDKATLTLVGETIVNGDITFESGNGTLILDKSVMIKGNIIGAEIVKR